MQGRRVGTLTLGIVLITLGILYLLINFLQLSIDITMIKFWPLVLVSLGLEVLIYNHYAGKENFSIKFDGISLLLIIIVLGFSSVLYMFGKLSCEILEPSSPLFYKKHIHYVSYVMIFLKGQPIFI